MSDEQQVFPEFKNVQTINRNELEVRLREEIKGCRPVSIVINTVPQMNKKVDGQPNPLYGRVKKRAYHSVMVGFNYQNSVNNQRDREGKETDFVAESRAWGEHVEGASALIYYNGQYYLSCKLERTIATQYLVDGEVVDYETVVKPYMPVRKESSRQGVDKTVKPMNPFLKNIETITMNGETYVIEKEEGVTEEVVTEEVPA